MDILNILREAVTPIAQVVSAVAIAVGYLLLVRNQREMIREEREEHTAGGRPQVVVAESYERFPEVYIVVQNFTDAPAREISFELSAPVESSGGFVVSGLPYFKEGMPFLAPRGRVSCFWDRVPDLLPALKKRGLEDGIAVTTRYKDLAGESYRTEWRINPLLFEGIRGAGSKGMSDLVNAVEGISEAATERDGSEGATRREGGPGQAGLR